MRGFTARCLLRPCKTGKLQSLIFALRFTACFAHAKTVVVDDYFPPLYANRPRKGQKIVQLWHGAGAFKKWGYSTAGKTWGLSRTELECFRIHRNYTHVIVSSKEVIPHYAEAFNISPDVIFPLGFPRSDVFFDTGFVKKGREALEAVFPEAKGKKIILYAPTFRGHSVNRAVNGDKINFEMLYSYLAGDYVVITKYHPFATENAVSGRDYSGFLLDVTGILDTAAALCAADVLISDYSSVIF